MLMAEPHMNARFPRRRRMNDLLALGFYVTFVIVENWTWGKPFPYQIPLLVGQACRERVRRHLPNT